MKHGTKNSENIEESKRAARGPQKCGARGICRFCHMVNPALTASILKPSKTVKIEIGKKGPT
jgi:hypothetical protein